MTTHAPAYAEDDTQRVARPSLRAPDLDAEPEPVPVRRRSPRLADMDLEPPSGPVPSEVLAYFEAAVAKEALRRTA
jgi:hypothetical protein